MTRANRIEARKKRVENRKARIAAKKSNEDKPKPEKFSKEKNLRNEKIKEAIKILAEQEPKEKLTIEICIHCYHYQHRLCWMLNSILQQKGNIPNIIVNISYAPNNGIPTTEEVCEFFRKQGLNIKETVVTEKQASNRAIARNRQVADTKADWILFVDSDMVYDPHLFADLQIQLKTTLKNETKVMGGDRHSLDIPFCIKHFEDDKRDYPCVIPDVAQITAKWPVKWVTGKNTVAGNFQLASVKAIEIIGDGKYTGRTREIWRATKSDRAFRCRMGGRRGIDIKPQYHLNHDRGGPEIQR